MTRTLFDSVEAMLASPALGASVGRPITQVDCLPFHSTDSLSGSRFLLVTTNGGTGPRFILKRIRTEWDWIMRATEDDRGRATLAWQTGLLDHLPPEISHEVVAAAVDGPGWALLLRDASAVLVPPGDTPITVDENEHFLRAMAALHAALWDGPRTAGLVRGSCSLRQRYQALTPRTAAREAGGPDPIPRMIGEGWQLLWTIIEPGVGALLRSLLADPTPLCTALARYPQTVIHGDWKLGNLGIWQDLSRRVVLLDWAVFGAAPPAVDLAWYLAVNSARLPVPKEAAIALYRQALASRLGDRFDDAWWEPQLDLSLLGGFLQLAWPKAIGAVHGENEAVRDRERAELIWWSEQVRRAAKQL